MKTIDTVTPKYQHRPLEELDIMDDFLFQELLSQEGDGEEFCRILLSTILFRTMTVQKKSSCIQKEPTEILVKNFGIC